MKMIFLVWVLNIACAVLRIKIPYNVTLTDMDIKMPYKKAPKESKGKYEDYSFMVFIMLKCHAPGWQRCSGFLVTRKAVLTAAHCFDFPGVVPQNIFLVGGQPDVHNYSVHRFTFRLGYDVDEKRFRVEERRASNYFIHPQYRSNNDEVLHNIAFIEFYKPFSMKIIKTIELSYESLTYKKKCTIVGWGLTRDRVYYLMKVLKNKEVSTPVLGCRLQKDKKNLDLCINPSRSGSCNSDSGSPLICDKKVFGVASHMIANGKDCAKSLEDYFTSISAEKEWVQNMMKSLSGATRLLQTNFSRIAVCMSLSFWIIWGIFS